MTSVNLHGGTISVTQAFDKAGVDPSTVIGICEVARLSTSNWRSKKRGQIVTNIHCQGGLTVPFFGVSATDILHDMLFGMDIDTDNIPVTKVTGGFVYKDGIYVSGTETVVFE